jgi:hypothetical protein
MAYLGNTPTTQSFISGTDYFNGTGAQTAFTLTRTVASVNDIEAVVNNVVQQPNDAYNISGTTITFTSAPSAGTNNVYVRYLSTTTQAITPSQNTVNYNTFDSNMQSAIGTGNKNRIINGGMVIDQRNAGASVTPADGAYTLDRWVYLADQASKCTIQQNAGSVTPPVGFSNYLGVTSTAATTITTSQQFSLIQRVEGFNMLGLNWGSADAKSVTLSFWVRSSLTGTFGGVLRNDAGNYNYPFSYTISSANTWEQKSVTITGATSGTWTINNGRCLQVAFSLGAGATLSGTAGAWTTSNFWSATGATQVLATNGATFYITGVQLEVGTQATSFEYRQYQQELALCQRYFEAGSLWREGTNAASGNFCVFSESFLVQKRANATFTYGNVSGANAGVASVSGPEAIYEWISPFDQTNARTGFAFRFTTNNNTSTIRQYWTASAEL